MRAQTPRAMSTRAQEALAELQRLITRRYPTATFEVSSGEDDPESIHLVTIVDDDVDAVLDVVIDRLLQLQIDEELPIHVIPVRPLGEIGPVPAGARGSDVDA